MITTRIIGTGSALPVHTLTNDDLSKFLDTSDEWIRTRTGICTRQLAGDGESTVTLAVEAGKKALLNSGVSPEEIQMVLVATCSSENYFPSVGCRVQEALGLTHASAMDLSAACSGFLFALHTAHAYIVSGYCRTVLVIGAETLSRTIDWSDRSTCVLFGDGAGACVVRGEETGLIQILQHSDGTKGDVLMDGRDIGTNVLPEADLKIYLTADVKVRAQRRYLELQRKGVESDIKEIEEDIMERDLRDMQRKIAPLKKAEDAIELNTSKLDINEVVDIVIDLVQEKRKK